MRPYVVREGPGAAYSLRSCGGLPQIGIFHALCPLIRYDNHGGLAQGGEGYPSRAIQSPRSFYPT